MGAGWRGSGGGWNRRLSTEQKYLLNPWKRTFTARFRLQRPAPKPVVPILERYL